MAPSLINRTMSMLHCVTKVAVMWIGERAPVVDEGDDVVGVGVDG